MFYCKKCGHAEVTKAGLKPDHSQRYQCKSCGSYKIK